jgi:hypothetical protein
MPEKRIALRLRSLKPPALFREFAAECTQLAKTAPTPDKRALYLKMASVWHSMAVRWEKKREAEEDWGR